MTASAVLRRERRELTQDDRQFRRIEHWFHQLSAQAPTTWEPTLQGEPDGAVRDRVLKLLRAASSVSDPFAAVLPQVQRASPVGQVLRQWRIVRELGSGGMGHVFEAERIDGQFESRVAIKMLHAFPTADARERLRRERQILATLDHPHIARLIDGGETEAAEPFLVMELVRGTSLSDWMKAHRPDRDTRLRLFEQLASAIAQAHRQHVVHRDIKPSNVMVRADGQAKLLDFGIAKLLRAGSADSTPECSTRIFTPGYASPEQLQGRAVTAATDVFSLGVLLGELLSGLSPARPESEPQWRPVTADAGLRGIMACATAEDAAARYENAAALHDDLRRWRHGLPLRAARAGAWFRSCKFLSRHRFAIAATVLAASALLLATWRIQHEQLRALQAERALRDALEANEKHRHVLSITRHRAEELSANRHAR